MTADKLHDALTLLPADLIAETDRKRSRPRNVIPWKRYAAMAACFVLVLSTGLMLRTALLSVWNASKKYESAAQPAEEYRAEDSDVLTDEAPAQTEAGRADQAPSNGAASAAGTVLSAPPELTVSAPDGAIATGAGSYTWAVPQEDGTTCEVIACGAHPQQIADRLPVLETGSSQVTLVWDVMPHTITVACWADPEAPEETAALTDGRLQVKPGTYIYEVHAHWDSGHARYAFRICLP